MSIIRHQWGRAAARPALEPDLSAAGGRFPAAVAQLSGEE